MGSPILQPTFTGGELSPSLWARVDLARYGTSVRTGKNFIVRPYGGLVNRPGFGFCGEVKNSAKRVRLLPFEFSSDVAYVMEVGEGYIRFIYRGAYVLAATSNAYSAGTTYAAGDLVTSGGIVYRSLQAGNIGHTPASSPTWWLANPVAEVVCPWTEPQLRDVAITQSADVVYMTHQSHKPIEVRRITANTFEVRDFANKNGPFGPINGDESVKVAISASTGNVTMTCGSGIFTPDMVGSLFYVEEKDLRGQRPWEAGWRNVVVNTLTRSDGKVYRASAVPGGTPTWRQTGGVRPVHDSGRAWDGPQDTRSTGSDTYTVGVEWEYLHSGFGIVQITGYTSPTQVSAVVASRIPDSCVGGLGSPGTTWTMSGNGSQLTFPIAGNVSPSVSDYIVSLNNQTVQPDPYYTPPDGTGGGTRCVSVDAWVYVQWADGFVRVAAGDVTVGQRLALHDPVTGESSTGVVTYSQRATVDIVRITTAKGVTLTCSTTAPIPVEGGMLVLAPDTMGYVVPVRIDGRGEWDTVVDVEFLGVGDVQHITVGDRCFWAADTDAGDLLHHNIKQVQ